MVSVIYARESFVRMGSHIDRGSEERIDAPTILRPMITGEVHVANQRGRGIEKLRRQLGVLSYLQSIMLDCSTSGRT